MAAIRLTPQTALPTVRQLGADLSRWVHEAGALSAAPQLARQLDQFQAALTQEPLTAEVWLDDGTSAEDAARWLLGTGGEPESAAHGHRSVVGQVGARRIRLMFSSAANPVVTPVGIPAPPILIRFGAADDRLAETGGDSYAVVINASTSPRVSDGRDAFSISRGEPDGGFARLFSGPFAQSGDLLQADAGARALESLASIAGLAMQQEARAIRAKRALAQQRAGTGQKAPAASLSDVVSAVRAKLQRTFQDFSRGIDDRFASNLAVPAAPFWTELDAHLQEVNDLERETRVKTVATRVSADVEAAWLDMVRTTLINHCIADLGALRDMLRVAAQDVEKTVADAGGPPIVVQFQHLTDERTSKVVEQQLVPQRRYQGEMARPGWFEYMMAARRYQMVVFMFLSAFGLSFLRTYRDFMIPAAIALLSLGILQVVHSVRRERVEGVARELDKIREVLRSETRRMVADVQRAWPALVAQHLSDQLPHVLSQVETSVRDFFNRLTHEGAEERQRLQRQLQAFESAERKLVAPEKGREAVAQAVAHVRGELRQLVGAIRPVVS